MRLYILILFFTTILCNSVIAQICNEKGQTPYIPLKICSDIISQTLQTNCDGIAIANTCKKNSPLTDANATWYSFTSTADDSLGFIIEPFDLGDNFNWMLFDVTGKTIAEIYTNKKLAIASNWSNKNGIRGASNAGTTLITCPADTNTFSLSPQIFKNHQYLLLIAYNGSVIPNKTGFKLTITQGSKSMIDTTVSSIQSVSENSYNCYASKISVIMNKNITCSSLSVDASNFSISGFAGNLITAEVLCGAGNTGDTINIYTDTKLTLGNHQLIIHQSNLNSRIADECGNTVIDGNSFPFIVVPNSDLKIDSIGKIGCKVDSVYIFFNKDVNPGSVAKDGSDFNFIGPSNILIKKAVGYGPYIKLDFTKKVTLGGNDTLMIQKGTDGNSLLDDCDIPIPVGYKVILNFPDTIATNFSYEVGYGCQSDTIHFSNNGNNGLNEWYWMFNGNVSGSQFPSFTNIDSGQNRLYIYFSNRRCSDSLTTLLNLLHTNFVPSFTMQNGACAGDTVPITNTSNGSIDTYLWGFGDGINSSSPNPGFHIFPTGKDQKTYTVTLIASRGNTCYKSFTSLITVLPNCYIAVPSAFTPNGDGLNDYLYPLNAYKAEHLIFRVFNRFGQIIFETRDWTVKWDGRYKSIDQPSGTYVWTLDYTDMDTGKKVSQKGTTVLIR